MPMGMPGWPDFAASTASIESARMAFAMRLEIAGSSWSVVGAAAEEAMAGNAAVVIGLPFRGALTDRDPEASRGRGPPATASVERGPRASRDLPSRAEFVDPVFDLRLPSA